MVVDQDCDFGVLKVEDHNIGLKTIPAVVQHFLPVSDRALGPGRKSHLFVKYHEHLLMGQSGSIQGELVRHCDKCTLPCFGIKLKHNLAVCHVDQIMDMPG